MIGHLTIYISYLCEKNEKCECRIEPQREHPMILAATDGVEASPHNQGYLLVSTDDGPPTTDGTRYSVLGTRYSVLGTRYSLRGWPLASPCDILWYTSWRHERRRKLQLCYR